jgi:hypothetical protein
MMAEWPAPAATRRLMTQSRPAAPLRMLAFLPIISVAAALQEWNLKSLARLRLATPEFRDPGRSQPAAASQSQAALETAA